MSLYESFLKEAVETLQIAKDELKNDSVSERNSSALVVDRSTLTDVQTGSIGTGWNSARQQRETIGRRLALQLRCLDSTVENGRTQLGDDRQWKTTNIQDCNDRCRENRWSIGEKIN